jgi:hypothetical protein
MKTPLLVGLLLTGCGDRTPLGIDPGPPPDGGRLLDARPARTPDSGPPPVVVPEPPEPPHWPCEQLGITTGGINGLREFEAKFIVPRCGQAKCHGPMGIFPPRNLHMPGLIRPTLVGQKAQLSCKTDFYIDRTDFTKSFVLAKVSATGVTVSCPTPGGKPDAGGLRMPNKTGMPTVVGDRLTDTEIECFTWWVEQVSRF